VLEAITHADVNRAAGVLLGELTHDFLSVALLVVLAALATGGAAYVLGQPPWLAGRTSRGRRPAAAENHTTDREPPRSPATVGTR
jgi:hypothetical protein